MEEAIRRQWQALHLRVALGETLSAEEQAVYDAGIRELEAEEEQTLNGSRENLIQARQRNREMRAEYDRLQRQIEEMEKQITVLEGRLDAPTKQLIGAGS